MILVDSSVWISHLKTANKQLVSLLQDNTVLIHPFILGELSLGSMKNRDEFLSLIDLLPSCIESNNRETLQFVNTHKLFGQGIGWIDANLLVSCFKSKSKIWTLDKSLQKIASRFHLSFTEF